MHKPILAAAVAVFVLILAQPARAIMPPPISYQAYVEFNGAPANGGFDLILDVYDQSVGGTKLTTAAIFSNRQVVNGLLNADLSIPETFFDGSDLWIEIQIRENGEPTYTTLTTRQRLGHVGNAFFAANGPANPPPPPPPPDPSGVPSPNLLLEFSSPPDGIRRLIDPLAASITTNRQVSGVPFGPLDVGPEEGFSVAFAGPLDLVSYNEFKAGGLTDVEIRLSLSGVFPEGTGFAALTLTDGAVVNYLVQPDANGNLEEFVNILFPPGSWSYNTTLTPATLDAPTSSPNPAQMLVGGVPVAGSVLNVVPSPSRNLLVFPPEPGMPLQVGPIDYGQIAIEINPFASSFIDSALSRGPLVDVSAETAGGLELLPSTTAAPANISFVPTSDGGYKVQVFYILQIPS